MAEAEGQERREAVVDGGGGRRGVRRRQNPSQVGTGRGEREQSVSFFLFSIPSEAANMYRLGMAFSCNYV